ncbi:DUF6090 family protein [Psychroserpens sp. BH13MA-6]
MGIFNTKRKGFFQSKRISGYLLYGIGEIILVVIGILIAVSINNYNQRKSSEQLLTSYLQVYKQDLVQDTIVVTSVLDYLKKRKEVFKMFLSDTVSVGTYKNNPQGYGLILSYNPFKLQQKGINLLQRYVNDADKQQDTLISRILTTHNAFDNLLEGSNERIGKDIDENMLYLKNNEPWIGDLLLGRLDNPQMMTYLLSPEYRARLAIHSTLVYGNLEPQLNAFMRENRQTLAMLEERLKG